MSKAVKVLLIISVICAAVGFIGTGNPMADGLAKALGGVFFILAYIAGIVHAAEVDSERGSAARH